MKKAVIAIGSMMILILIIFIIGRSAPVQRYTGALKKIDLVLSMAERIQDLVGEQGRDLERAMKAWESAEKEIASLNRVIANQHGVILKLEKDVLSHQQKTEILIGSIPPVSSIEPQDMEECRQELDIVREIADKWKAVSEYRLEETVLIRTINDRQGIIIESQGAIIQKQSNHIAALHDSQEMIIARANSTALIGIFSGTGAGLFIAAGMTPVGIGVAAAGVILILTKN
jgi:hypothetical protein